MTIKEYVKTRMESSNPEPTYAETYKILIEDIGIDMIKPYIPFTREQIVKALKEDKYLNNLPLTKWDLAANNLRNVNLKNIKLNISAWSLSERVCLLKESAILWANQTD